MKNYSKIKKSMLLLNSAGISISLLNSCSESNLRNDESSLQANSIVAVQSQVELNSTSLTEFVNNLLNNPDECIAFRNGIKTDLVGTLKKHFYVNSLRTAFLSLTTQYDKDRLAYVLDGLMDLKKLNPNAEIIIGGFDEPTPPPLSMIL